ncbi:hypothetical protein [Oryza sativa Japonica Group]|uniref:Uncharacterized protein n=1 Tax=Oryza sativa subsp. japonica TaxID=39947 RepID=Q94CM6_ORYSJ|nr:hypothetical protein [Oryza sativa Japonica Group]BAB93404.1 hypothetical protein [Oryza sativa Japonica Group]
MATTRGQNQPAADGLVAAALLRQPRARLQAPAAARSPASRLSPLLRSTGCTLAAALLWPPAPEPD